MSRFESDAVAVVAGIVVLWLLAFASWGLYRGFERLARWRLRRLYDDPQLRAFPEPGDVGLSYTTFHGLLAWFTPIVHTAYGPADRVRRLLGRLFRFTLVWGLLTWGAPFYLLGAVTYYLRERRELARQLAAGGFDPALDDIGESPSRLPSADTVDAHSHSASSPVASSPVASSPVANSTDANSTDLDNPYAPPQFLEPVATNSAEPQPESPSYILAFCGLLAMPIGLIVAMGSVASVARGAYGAAVAGLAMGTFIAITGYGWVRAVWRR